MRAFFDTLADAAGAAILPHFRAELTIEDKQLRGVYDPVTIADRAAETALRTLITARFPDHGILGEEFGAERTDADHVWVLDPIDGTRAFISGLPVWGTLIGLTHMGQAVQGMMCQPFTGERFFGDTRTAGYTGPGGPRPLKTRRCAGMSDAVLFTTTPAIFTPGERAVYDAVERQVRLVRYGADCYAYCMLAAGLVDLVIESGLQPYDIVALIPIIEGAGGIVTNWQGGPCVDGGQVLAAGDPATHAAALNVLGRA